MTSDKPRSRMAVLIDFENIARNAEEKFGSFDLHLLFEAIQARGEIAVKRAYGDWGKLDIYRDILHQKAIELVQLYSVGRMDGKNRADVRLAVDAMELVFTHKYIDTIVVVSGDSDFSSLMVKVHEYGKRTIGAGVKGSTSRLLVTSCDEFVFYDDLLDYDEESGRRLLEHAVRALLRNANEPVNGAEFKKYMLKLDPDFSEKALGFSNFQKFLESYPEIVRVEKARTTILVHSAKLQPVQSKPSSAEVKAPAGTVAKPPVAVSDRQLPPKSQAGTVARQPSQKPPVEPPQKPSAKPQTGEPRTPQPVKPQPVTMAKQPSAKPQPVEPAQKPSAKPAAVALVLPPPPPLLIGPAAADPQQKGLSEYLANIALRPLPPQTRNEVLNDILLFAPKAQTLNQIISELSARYDARESGISRDDLREVAKLACQCEVFDFGEEHPSLATVIRKTVESDLITVIRRGDQVYLRKLLAAGFTLTPELAAASCLASPDRVPYYAGILKILEKQGYAKMVNQGYANAVQDIVDRTLAGEGLKKLREDLNAEGLPKDEVITRARADELFKTMTAPTARDFSAAAEAGLKAAKILAELIRRGEPGNSPEELLWYLAGYCKAKGEYYSNDKKYASARDYYLMFFSIMQEGSLASERSRGLLRPMQSFYWQIIARPLNIDLNGVSNGYPEKVLLRLKREGRAMADAGLLDMARRLARVNSSLLRASIESLARLDEDKTLIKGTVDILQAAHDEVVIAAAAL